MSTTNTTQSSTPQMFTLKSIEVALTEAIELQEAMHSDRRRTFPRCWTTEDALMSSAIEVTIDALRDCRIAFIAKNGQ